MDSGSKQGGLTGLIGAYNELDQLWQSCVLVVGFGAFFLLLELSMTRTPVATWISKLLHRNPKLEEKDVRKCMPMVVTRIVGFIHNGVQVPIAVWAISNPALREHLENRFFGTTVITHYMLCAAGGFFLHDAVSCLIRESPFYIVHGLTCCIGYALGAAYGCGHFYGGLFLMWEVSTPFVQLRWVLYKMGLTETLLYRINGTLMVLSFFVARILFGTYFTVLLLSDTYRELQHPTANHYQPRAIFVGFCAAAVTVSGLNYYWFWQMANLVWRVVKQGHTWTDISQGKNE